MKRSPIDIAASLARLSALTSFRASRGMAAALSNVAADAALAGSSGARDHLHTARADVWALPKASLRKLDRASVEAFSREQGTSPSRITLKPRGSSENGAVSLTRVW